MNSQAIRRAAKAIWEANPSMSPRLVRRLAVKAVSRYLKEAATAPERPEGTGHPREPQRPSRPTERAQDKPVDTSFDANAPAPEWYQHNGDPKDLANSSVSADNTLWQQRSR